VAIKNYSDPILSFVVSRPRSGSTFFGDRLSRHPEILVAPESNIAPRLVSFFQKKKIYDDDDGKELADYVLEERKFKDWGLPSEKLLQALKNEHASDWPTTLHIICRAYRDWQKPEAKIVVLKKGGWYYKNTDLLLSTYPNSFFIGIIRDPRAIYNSSRRAIHSETKEPMENNAFRSALDWLEYVNLLKNNKARWPQKIHCVKYEDFLHDVKGTLTNTWKQLGLKQVEESEIDDLLKIQTESHLVTPATKHLHNNVSQKPLMERAEKWKDELPYWKAKLIRLICRKRMNEFGYR